MRSHHEGSYMWNEMPYDVEPDIWQQYYVMLENFVTLFPNRVMYVHGCMHLPVEPTREIRGVLYRLFIFNTPYSTYNLIRIQRFRLFFRRVKDEGMLLFNISAYYHFRVVPRFTARTVYGPDAVFFFFLRSV